MPRNGSGTYSLPQSPFVAGTTISSAAVNSNFSDIASALTGSLSRDGQAGMTGPLKLPNGSSNSPAITFTNATSTGLFYTTDAVGVSIGGTQIASITKTGFTGAGAVPVGTIVDFAGSTVPSEWYLCYGQAVSRTTYSALFSAIGTLYGSGDGSTTFNLPDLRGRASFGADAMGGTAAGRLSSTYFGGNNPQLAVGGGLTYAQLTTGNLPAYTPAGTISNGAISVSITQNAAAYSSTTTPGGGFSANNAAQATISASASQGTSYFYGSAQGGNSTAFAIVPPALISNKIIFAGA